jgi:hypothetical protein
LASAAARRVRRHEARGTAPLRRGEFERRFGSSGRRAETLADVRVRRTARASPTTPSDAERLAQSEDGERVADAEKADVRRAAWTRRRSSLATRRRRRARPAFRRRRRRRRPS